MRKMRTGKMTLRKAKRCSSALFGLTYFWKSRNWMMEARQKGRKGKRKQRWRGSGVSSVQDQEKTVIMERRTRRQM